MKNWKEEINSRKNRIRDLNKQISRIKKQIKDVGTSDYIQFLCDEIENKYGYICREGRDNSIIIFKKNSTPKQVQYRQNILNTVYLMCKNGKYYFDETLNKYGLTNFTPEELIEMPDTVEEVFNYITSVKRI